MSKDFAKLILEMANAFNRGHVKMLEPRSAKGTTPTSYETFVREVSCQRTGPSSRRVKTGSMLKD